MTVRFILFLFFVTGFNTTYTALFLNFVPLPLVLLTNTDGTQNVHIAPEAFSVASTEFADEIDFWQDALPGELKGQLSSVSFFVSIGDWCLVNS